MKTIIAIVLLIAFSISLLSIWTKKRIKDVWPFYAKKPMSNPEQILYFRLVSALPEHVVLAQVQLSRFLGVKKGYRFNEWNNRINRMSADFLICKKDMSIETVIELDDSTHENAKRRKDDEKKNDVIRSAGLKIIRWNVKKLPDIEEIKSAINQKKYHA